MHLPTPERLVLVATVTAIVLDGRMPARNDKGTNCQKSNKMKHIRVSKSAGNVNFPRKST
jgi:hypothetical protein